MEQALSASSASEPRVARKAPNPMPLRDELELEWYFSRGQIAFERSTFGGMLERAYLMSDTYKRKIAEVPVLDKRGEVIGYERAISARPTAELRQATGYVPDLDTLQRYAHVSRILKNVSARSRAAEYTLECLYGDLGQRWVGSELYGRLGALFHLTTKGRQILDEARAVPGAIDVTDVKRMETLVTVQLVQPKPDRAQQFAYCFAQAEAMAQRARQAWAQAKAGL